MAEATKISIILFRSILLRMVARESKNWRRVNWNRLEWINGQVRLTWEHVCSILKIMTSITAGGHHQNVRWVFLLGVVEFSINATRALVNYAKTLLNICSPSSLQTFHEHCPLVLQNLCRTQYSKASAFTLKGWNCDFQLIANVGYSRFKFKTVKIFNENGSTRRKNFSWRVIVQELKNNEKQNKCWSQLI